VPLQQACGPCNLGATSVLTNDPRSGHLGVCRSDLLTPTGIGSGSISMLDALLEIDFCLFCELN
jgi:hypothetical protein